MARGNTSSESRTAMLAFGDSRLQGVYSLSRKHMGIWGSYFNIPTAIVNLLKGDSKSLKLACISLFVVCLPLRSW